VVLKNNDSSAAGSGWIGCSLASPTDLSLRLTFYDRNPEAEPE
jgi:hypothetical protein